MSDNSSNSTASTQSSAATTTTSLVQLRPVPVNSFHDVRPVLQQMLYQQLDCAFINKAEKISGLDREKLFFICAAVVVLLLAVSPFNMALSTLIGVLYPLFATILAVSNGQTSEHVQWLIYWILFAYCSELDIIVSHFFSALLPLYLPLKTIFLLHMALPQTYGAHNFYVKYAQKILRERE